MAIAGNVERKRWPYNTSLHLTVSFSGSLTAVRLSECVATFFWGPTEPTAGELDVVPHTRPPIYFDMHLHFFLFVLVVIVASCGRSSSESDPPTDRATESASRIAYQCESGRALQVSYPSDTTAVVEYESQTLQMTRAVSASGARYIGEGLEWWTKGSGPESEGTLFRHESGGTTGETVEQCEQSSGAA